MSLLPRFADPSILLLLPVLLGLAIGLGLKVQSLNPSRKFIAIALRCIILAALILALAGTEIVRRNDRLAVFFLLDQSNSIPEELRLASTQWIRNYADAYMTDDDEAGVIVFGEDASIELGVAERLGLRDIRSFVGADDTDLAAAIRLAMAAFPQGYMRRIVVLTDGNETRGSALDEIKLASAEGTGIELLPLRTGGGSEVRVKEITAPSQTDAEEPFQLRIVVNAKQDGPATLNLYQRTADGRRMLRPQDVQLQQGDNVFLLSQELAQAGFYEYEVQVDSPDDTVVQNNVGRAFTTVHGEPRVLYVEANPGYSTYLLPALEREGVDAEQIDPYSLPSSPAQLLNYDSIVLSDVSSTMLSADQMGALEAIVRDHGVGLVMIGGPESFGAGGYLDTPVERALPVDMDIKQRKVMPRGALALILHTCEFQNGNAWARDIALASLNVLASQDLMAVLGYMWDKGDTFIYDLREVGDKSFMTNAIRQASTQIGDMPSVEPTLKLALQALIPADAAAKRIVMISDGDPGAPTQATVQSLINAGIAVSTICISPHSMNDQNMLRNLAQATGGRYYFVNNPRNLPQIFTKEAATVRRGMLIETEFTPAMLHDSELLAGLATSGLPPLRGYVVTTAKDSATVPLISHEEDPVLAHWRYGLGKSVAFTSDITNRWAAPWLSWEGFDRFWAQTIRWSMREVSPGQFRVETRQADGRGHIRIDATDEAGNFVNFLDPKAIVTTPEFDRLEVEVAQTAPGIYEGTFPVDESGVYMANISYADSTGNAGGMTAGLAVDYSREYEFNETNLPLLEQLAAVSGGRLIDLNSNPFVHDLEASPTITPIWHWLVMLAACLLPIEIFVRRVVVPMAAVAAFFQRQTRRLPGLKRLIPAPAARAQATTGRYEAATRDYGTPTAPTQQFGTTSAPSAAPESTTPPPPEAKPAGRTDYTSQLLAAKERAKHQQKKRDE